MSNQDSNTTTQKQDSTNNNDKIVNGFKTITLINLISFGVALLITSVGLIAYLIMRPKKNKNDDEKVFDNDLKDVKSDITDNNLDAINKKMKCKFSI